MGDEFKEAYYLAKSFHIIKNSTFSYSNDKAVPNPNEAITRFIGEKNEKKYFVATQDTTLRSVLREIPGVPLLYLNRSVLVFEDISKATLAISRKVSPD